MQNNEKRRQAARARKSSRALRAKLLSLGGTDVVPLPDPHSEVLLQRGQVMGGKPCKKVRGEAMRCLFTAALRCFADPRACQIATGYGLTADGLWRPHSWLWDGKRVVETTAVREIYFGVILDRVEVAEVVYILMQNALPGMDEFLHGAYGSSS